MRRLAIVVPVYNNLATIAKTLDSVLGLRDMGNLELVVSDDGSTDGTRAFLESWFLQHGRSFRKATFLSETGNSGISANHDRAFRAVQSEYGLYVGGDDLLSNPSMLLEIDAFLESACPAIAKLDVEALYERDGRRVRLYEFKLSFFHMSANRQFAALSLFGNFLYAGPGTLLHIPTLRSIGGGFDSRFRTFEDLPLFMAFLAAGHRMRFVPVRGVVWVRRSGSLSLNDFAGTRSLFELEGSEIEALVKLRWNLLSLKDRLTYKTRRLPKYVRYLVFALSPSWLRLRLVPSVINKVRQIGGHR